MLFYCMFQGEMGSEGTRGLSGEAGNEGAKVYTAAVKHVCSYEHCKLLTLSSNFSSLIRETMACQDPGDRQGPQGSLGETYVSGSGLAIV